MFLYDIQARSSCLSGSNFFPALILVSYVFLMTAPIPGWFYKVLFSERELHFLEGRHEQPDPNTKVVVLAGGDSCRDRLCKEIVLETSYKVARKTSDSEQWVIYEAGSGNACLAQKTSKGIISLKRDGFIHRCIVAKIRNDLPGAISIRRYKIEPSRKGRIVHINGWEIIELNQGVERSLGGWIWGDRIEIPLFSRHPLFGSITREIGESITKIEALNRVLATHLDGLIDTVE